MEHQMETGGTTSLSTETPYHRRRGVAATQQEEDKNIMMTEYANMDSKDGIMRMNNHDDDEQEHHHHPQTAAVVHESHMRSLLKGLTWRFLATTTTTVIAYLITGEVHSALRIGFFEFFAKLAIYYVHERIWTKIRI